MVFDPFAGSGTTVVAAKRMGRGYLACEREEEYYRIMEQRLHSTSLDAQDRITLTE